MNPANKKVHNVTSRFMNMQNMPKMPNMQNMPSSRHRSPNQSPKILCSSNPKRLTSMGNFMSDSGVLDFLKTKFGGHANTTDKRSLNDKKTKGKLLKTTHHPLEPRVPSKPASRVRDVAVRTRPGRTGDKKKINQDNYIIHTKFLGITAYSVFGVFDGHGKDGHKVSQYLVTYLVRSFYFILICDR